MNFSEQIQSLTNTLVFAAGIVLFALNIHDNGAYKVIGITALLLPAYAIYRQTFNNGVIKDIFLEDYRPTKIIKALMAGIFAGLASGIYYRYQSTGSILPEYLTVFALTATSIGIAEELIFRGVTFYLMKPIHLWLRIIMAALLHAGYKTLLFVPGLREHSIDLWSMFGFTFQAGLVLGAIRIWAGHIAPPVAAHALWDLVVYGDRPDAPWWVW